MMRLVQYFLLMGLVALSLDSYAAELMTQNAIDWQQGQQLYQTNCAACHGADGNATATNFPKLAGQNRNYLQQQLLDYQQNKRVNPIMQPIAQKLSSTDMANILAYIASFKANNGGVDPSLLDSGQSLYRAGNFSKGIPACAACHGPGGLGNAEAIYPALAGQNTAYIIEQLQLFQEKKRTNDPKQMMQTIAGKLSPQEMQAVASFINGLRPTE